jgi:hypothetical protein
MVIGYHATNSAAAARIFRCGFRCGAKGLAGGAIYFATSEADARRKSKNGDDVVFRCELKMGQVCELDQGCPSMTPQMLKQMGYDSVKIHRRHGDEYVVYEPSRVHILVRILVDSDDSDDDIDERLRALERYEDNDDRVMLGELRLLMGSLL